MNFSLTEQQESLRREVREYYAQLLPPEVEAKLRSEDGAPELRRSIIRQMGDDGWLGPGWPTEFGGRGLTPIEQYLCVDESKRAGAPTSTLNQIGPPLLEHGSAEQKKFFLPKMLKGEILICIGYSEPGAGTDLAALQTRAVRDGDEYVINGQKMWTSIANSADYVWLAARTDPNAKKQKGISIFLIPMNTPGIKVLPIKVMGESDIAQVFYEDVRIPASCRVGDENDGWRVITSQLNHERAVFCTAGIVQRALSDVREWAQGARLSDGCRVIDQDWVQLSLARVHAKLEFLRLLGLKMGWEATKGDLGPADASVSKVFGTEFYLEAFRLLMEIVGQPSYLKEDAPGAALHAHLENGYREHLVMTFAGGTNEIQRDLIAIFGLGMPRSPR